MLLASSVACAGAPLPEPLTLKDALALVHAPHPDVLRAQSQVERQQAQRRIAHAQNDFSVNLEGRLRWVDASDLAVDDGPDDHRFGIRARKRLYDFGRTDTDFQRANAELRASQVGLTIEHVNRYLAIQRAYFDVVEADLRYVAINESMALAFLRADRARERMELGQSNELQQLELEAEYQKVRQQRFEAEYHQRATRARLANLLNSPEALPATVGRPDLKPIIKLPLPDVDKETASALQNNSRLQELRAKIEAAEKAVDLARRQYGPELYGEVEVFEYSRELGGADRARAGLMLDVPLWTGDRRDALVAEQRSELQNLQAQKAATELTVRQTVLDIWLELQSLLNQHAAVLVEARLRNLAFDRAQAEYELEFQADLGNSMADLSAVTLSEAQTEFALAQAWARLDAVTGRLAAKLQNKSGG